MAQKIMFSRPEERIDRYRTYEVIVNNEVVYHISNGETIEIETVLPGGTIECRIDWRFSNTYQLPVSDKDVVFLRVISGMITVWLMYFVFFLFFASSYVVSAIWKNMNEAGMTIRKITFLIPILYFGYYYTFGRHKYLRIEEDY